MDEQPVRVGVVGAGPWARRFTAPLLASGPHTELSGVWARRRDQADALAQRHGSTACDSLDDLLARSDAIAFAVPPDVQADLAPVVARAGRALLLEKPVAASLEAAEALAGAVADAQVPTQLVLTNRYLPSVRRFLAEAATFPAYGGRASFLGDGAVPGTAFATPWRLAEGALLDLGPHALDAIEAALGPIVDLRATGHPLRLVAIQCEHEGGAVSQVTLSVTTAGPSGLVVELVGASGRLAHDPAHMTPEATAADVRDGMATIASELATCVRTRTSHQLDVHLGVRLQRLIERATAQLRG